MLTETYDNRLRRQFNGFTFGWMRNSKRGTIYRTGTDERGRPVEVTLPTVDFRVIE
ncbi:MAG: hypothetical protein GY807_16670 [Gammaproteobacteria bacterium]|nr:hypothetical protein [Gammaproteobacteria bacterium]